ncbi:hypothetical protein M011DRAFT_413781 [Sporormia fimetaria CBS 119925]|uniref:PhoD-like phosphatase domain-containing protein n=1 Tax=Sporormia fimetaria CBS 119925 TaxID=1340428 RepID=A0A6A6UWR1_9PLEO|nr:hypothetical protein M011DRAFT_413781 [Sporormia fimetaria CBS 119925]
MATQVEIPHEHANAGVEGVGTGPPAAATSHTVEIICGPLLNYKHMSNESGGPTWHGSVLIVTTPGERHPLLNLSPLGAVHPNEPETAFSGGHSEQVKGELLYEDPDKAFWRFRIHVPMQKFESRWSYSVKGLSDDNEAHPVKPQQFVVPSVTQSMRIMFHSCNGFSVGTDLKAWVGPVLWNDVLRMHEQKPFHVMIGGGDQIYQDSVRVNGGPLEAWTNMHNPHKRREYPFNEKLREKCDEFYYQNYIKWYGTKPFSDANGQIPQLNIWDDHDIIDGFGSYTDHFMKCSVFRGIGGVAHKYYLLFQHHIPPPKSTYTTDAPRTMNVGEDGPADPYQLKKSFVMTNDTEDPSYIIGAKPGPYVEEHSRSLYCQLGARVAFCGIDARTERTRHQINYPETYQQIFSRLRKEFEANREIKHLILLLGVPIAYPRLQWLENILSSPMLAPLKFLNKRFGFGGDLFNKFDGSVDLLDDLDDHYTAHQHKRERRELIHMLQKLSKEYNVRVTILGGDVHLAAIGRFYSNPKLGIRAENDFRYMPNVISSAITNKPPPQAVANLLARRNKIHHLDHDTDETLLEIFNRDPGPPGAETDGAAAAAQNDHKAPNGAKTSNGTAKVDKKTSAKNHATMPSRNYAIIAESNPDPTYSSSAAPPVQGQVSTTAPSGTGTQLSDPIHPKDNPRKPIHIGEKEAGTGHPAAQGLMATGLCGPYGLDVTLRVEINRGDPEGRTEGYGFSVPALDVAGVAPRA